MPKYVVLVDDDPDDLDIMQECFSAIDETITCESFLYPAEALRKLGGELVLIPDLIFLDFNMGKMRGDQCLVQLRRMNQCKDVPIVLHSTSLPRSVSDELINKGATFTFQKPVRAADYITILKGILNKSYQQNKHIVY